MVSHEVVLGGVGIFSMVGRKVQHSEGSARFGWLLVACWVFYLGVFHSLANMPLDDDVLFLVHARFWQQPSIFVWLLAGIGIGCGLASGMFGIGGGVVVTPSLCLLTDMPYACVLGTTLASMVPPSLVSAGTHRQMGNVVGTVVMPLGRGSRCGYLQKRSAKDSNVWRNRWFVLLEDKLWYCKRADSWQRPCPGNHW